MPGTSDPRRAIVAVWHKDVGLGGEFLGSGAFISPRLVLTAKHLVDGKQPQEVLFDFIPGQHAVPAGKIYLHEQYDVALIDFMRDFSDQDFVLIDCRNSGLEQAKIDLYGVNLDTKNRDQCNNYTLGTWNAATGEYLFDHAQRKGFSGGIVVHNGNAVGVISKRHISEQQGVMVPLYAVVDWLGQCIDLKGTSFSLGIPASKSPIAQNEFARRVREKIRLLLEHPWAKALRDAIIQQAGAGSAAEALVPEQIDFSTKTLRVLHEATESCLKRLAEEQKQEVMSHTRRIAREVFGWLVLLAVDLDQANHSGCVFDPWRCGVEVPLPLKMEVGVETLMAALGDRYAAFRLKIDDKKQRRVVGNGGFFGDDLEIGLEKPAQLKEILKRIWVEVMKDKAPDELEKGDLEKLNYKLAYREELRQNHYYITVPLKQGNAPLSDKALLKNLLGMLPSLRVIYMDSGQGTGILLLNEYHLWAAIDEFLLMLQDTP